MAFRVASCHFPVSQDIHRNVCYIRIYMEKAAQVGAHLLHTSEACITSMTKRPRRTASTSLGQMERLQIVMSNISAQKTISATILLATAL